MGNQCAFCHSTVDDSFAPGIGMRLDGWANRDLNVGAIVSLAPNLKPFLDLLGVDVATVKKVFASWGPERFDAELDKDGKAFRPDGKQAGTLIPPAFRLAGVNLHTWTGFGSVPYWNAFVAVTEMCGSGTFFDARLSDKDQYPVSAKSGSWNSRNTPDKTTGKLAALHFYQLSIPRRTLRRGHTTRLHSNGARRFSTVRRSVQPAMCRPSSPSREIICMLRARSASTRFRLTARRPTCTVRRLSPGYGRTKRAASITTDDLPHCSRW